MANRDFFMKESSYTEKIFKASYNHYRKHKPEIFKAFSFKHLSDVTQYYVHPNNQSYKGTTSLCQSIGEAIVLFQMIYNSKMKGGQSEAKGDFYKAFYDKDINSDTPQIGYYIDISLDDSWRRNRIVSNEVFGYRATLGWKNNFFIAAINEEGNWAMGPSDNASLFYLYLPMFLLCIVREMDIDSEYKQLLLDYCQNPTVERFVRLHEDLYQKYKDDVFHFYYSSISDFDTSSAEVKNLSADFERIIENRIQKENILQNMKLIKFDDNEFKTEYKEFIPKLSAEFVIDKKLKPICNALVTGDVLSVLLHGPAGTGKTIGCKLMAQAIGLPVMETVNCTENLDEFILGKYIPKDEKIVFQESYVTKAIRDGGAVVFEEINFAKPQHLAFLNSLLDDNGFVRLDNGEVVKRHKNFRFLATMNMGYFGTKELNQALYNRFNAIIELDELSDEAISSMLVARVPECENEVEKILSVYHKIKKRISSEELDYVISPRNLENWARLAKYEGYIQASEQAIIPIAKNDKSFEKAIRSLIELYSW